MVLTVRKDIFYPGTTELNSKNIQFQSEKLSTQNESDKSTTKPQHNENIKKRKALADITSNKNIPHKYLKPGKENEVEVDAKIRKGLNNFSTIIYSETKQTLEEKSKFNNENGNENVSAKRRYSNDMKDAVKVICKICEKVCFLTTMRQHTRKMHHLTIDEYKGLYGNTKSEIVEKIFHHCGLCSESILLDSDEISWHLRRNHKGKVTHKDYNAQFMKTRCQPINPANGTSQTDSNAKEVKLSNDRNVDSFQISPSLPIPSNQKSLQKSPPSADEEIEALKDEVLNLSTDELLMAIELALCKS